MKVRNETRNAVLGQRVRLAGSSRERRTGLLNRSSLESSEGLLIQPCEAVHTFWMKFTIDVLHLDKSKRVKKVRPQLKPWRLSACLSAYSVLELPSGTIEQTGTRVGDQLVFEKA